MNCDYENCNIEWSYEDYFIKVNGKPTRVKSYATYQLIEEGKKKWVHVCRKHWDDVLEDNEKLKYDYPYRTWKEINKEVNYVST